MNKQGIERRILEKQMKSKISRSDPPETHLKGPPPKKRRQPLPWQAPKDSFEDPEAPLRVQQLLQSSSYRQADQDTDFLNLDDVRATRLQLDYLKTELGLREHGVRHTIVVFGSTRIPEPVSAKLRVEEAQKRLRTDPQNLALQRALTTVKRIAANSRYYPVAQEFGKLVAESCKRTKASEIVVTTGGGPGIMEAANRGAYRAGSKTVGFNITLPYEQYPNPYITPNMCFRFHYFAVRKLHLLLRAKALVVFPGGYGTLDELFEVLTLIQTRKIAPLPVILVGEAFWSRAVDFNFLVEEGVIDTEDEELFWYAETAHEIWDDVVKWHHNNGAPLFG